MSAPAKNNEIDPLLYPAHVAKCSASRCLGSLMRGTRVMARVTSRSVARSATPHQPFASISSRG